MQEWGLLKRFPSTYVNTKDTTILILTDYLIRNVKRNPMYLFFFIYHLQITSTLKAMGNIFPISIELLKWKSKYHRTSTVLQAGGEIFSSQFPVWEDKTIGLVQVDNYDIILNFFHISHNLTWISVHNCP